MWVYTKDKDLVNLSTAAQLIMTHDEGGDCVLKAVYSPELSVILVHSSDQSEVDSIKNRLYQYLKQGTTTCDLRFS